MAKRPRPPPERGSHRFTNRYKLKEGNEILYFGITDDLKRRESEHKSKGMKFSKMEKVGPAVTRESALKWERESIKKYKKSHGGKSPKYND